ncbi:flavodoxin family protein [Geomonas subterranea]|uniref:Flavodoxin family protein n=1 Tax=Geomonas subterranea TaxID=2847989 RepID=A0ABX8LDG8_9BACT|nr:MULTISPECIES: flavodoxin family protein [Geomonas]QXE89381.1 flavodoxin family protein [Geomonas subterranea]QXM08503.1 flavodoxin family protein [Geomonas subterranea]
MDDAVKVVAIVGSYRKGGMVDQVVDEVLAGAAQAGAQVQKIYLLDTHVEFCTNCRLCTQSPGGARGICPVADEMARVLDLVEGCQALVLASPTNFGSVTALTKRFVERLVCYAYWPWGVPAPKVRSREKPRRAVLVAASAAPGFLARLFTPVVKTLRQSAELLGASCTGTIFVGLAAREERQGAGQRVLTRARLMGRRLVTGR